MKDVVVEVHGGVVVGLFCDIVDARFVIVDRDSLETGDVDNGVGVFPHDELESLPSELRKYYRRAISA